MTTELPLDPQAADMLTAAKTINLIPRTIVICGSTRFMDQMEAADRVLTWAGHIVHRPGACNLKHPHPLWDNPADAEAGKQRLASAYRAKIRLADEVLVICPGGYIGDSTRAEITYATALGKPIRYSHPIEEATQ